MTNARRTVITTPWDSADYLTTPEARAAYLEAVLCEGDANLIAYAIGQIAKSQGMTQVAQKTGVTREALYKSLRVGGDPRLTTLRGALNAMGLRLSVVPMEKKADVVMEPRAAP